MKIEIKNLYKSFQDNVVLKDLNLCVDDHEIVVLMGLSGSGKTTLLRCLCDLETADRGTMIINGKYLLKEENGVSVYANKEEKQRIRMDIGLVFQNYQLFPHRSVLQNLMDAPLYHKQLTKDEAVQKGEELLAKLQIADKKYAYPNTLSGGQKQRVAIARACMLQPSILCFDEPTSALDIDSIASVTSIIKNLSKDMAILIITHDEGFAQTVGTRVIRINDINQT